jgi:hypothetical protein
MILADTHSPVCIYLRAAFARESGLEPVDIARGDTLFDAGEPDRAESGELHLLAQRARPDEDVKVRAEDPAAGVIDNKPAVVPSAVGETEPVVLPDVHASTRRDETALALPRRIRLTGAPDVRR